MISREKKMCHLLPYFSAVLLETCTALAVPVQGNSGNTNPQETDVSAWIKNVSIGLIYSRKERGIKYTQNNPPVCT